MRVTDIPVSDFKMQQIVKNQELQLVYIETGEQIMGEIIRKKNDKFSDPMTSWLKKLKDLISEQSKEVYEMVKATQMSMQECSNLTKINIDLQAENKKHKKNSERYEKMIKD